jgi:hypothetical protein
MSRKTIALGVVLTGLAAAVGAESPDRSGPPPVLAIGREEIKPGRMGAHEKLNVAFVSALAKTPSQSYWLGLVPVSGDDNSTLFLQAFGSFAEVESQRNADEQLLATASASAKADMEALEKQGLDLHDAQRTSLARYRADLSFRPATMEEAAQSRYFSIITTRVKPGRIPDNVVSGAPMGTFVSIRPLKSLKVWDDDFATPDQTQKALIATYGGEEAARKVRMLAADAIQVADSAVYALNPKISRPAPEFAKHDVAFWSPKPADTRTAAARPGTTKQPALVKQEAQKQ